MKVELKTKRYVTCPNGCAHEFMVEHLAREEGRAPRTAGPWYCDDCGQGWRITYSREGFDFEAFDGGADKTSGHDGKMRSEWVILELPPQTEPVRFKVKWFRFTPKADEERARYYFEEHTCPTNWLKNVEEVYVGNRDDPHGLWELVSVYDHDASDERGEE